MQGSLYFLFKSENGYYVEPELLLLITPRSLYYVLVCLEINILFASDDLFLSKEFFKYACFPKYFIIYH